VTLLTPDYLAQGLLFSCSDPPAASTGLIPVEYYIDEAGAAESESFEQIKPKTVELD
jgi:hypothetical protein